MFQVVSLAVFALLVARLLRAPAGSWRWIAAAAVAVLAGSQLLPEGNAFRADVAGSLRSLFWVGVAAIPVAAYAVMIRRLRRRTGAIGTAPAPTTRPRGLVQFSDDSALAAETAAALAGEAAAALPGDRLSLGWRDEDGTLAGHLRLRIADGAAEIEMLRVSPTVRRQGIGAALLRAGEGEAAARGAARIGALVADWQAPGFFAGAGYAAAPPHLVGGGLERRWMEKALA